MTHGQEREGKRRRRAPRPPRADPRAARGNRRAPRKDRGQVVRRCEVALHLGRKGSGKSYLAKRLVEKAPAPITVWDPRFEWAGPRAADPPRRSRAIVYDPRAFLEAQAQSSKPLAQVTVWQGGTFEAFSTYARRTGGLVVIDEAQLVAGRGHCSPFLELATTCRHTGTSMLLCAQRAATLDPSIRAQVDTVRVWRTTEPRDLEWLTESYGPEFSRKLPSLQGHNFCEWSA